MLGDELRGDESERSYEPVNFDVIKAPVNSFIE